MLTHVGRYRLYCNTESAVKYVLSEDVPTACPTNAGHTLDTTKTAEMDCLSAERPTRLEDNFPWVAVNNLPKGTYQIIRGCGDDIANGEHDGTDFEIDESTTGNHGVEWQFMHLCFMKSGECRVTNKHKSDRVSFGVYAPATAGVSNTGAGDYDKSIVGAGKYRFQPVTAGTGDWDLDIEETLNANVSFTKAVPYPNPLGTGYFDFNAVTGEITDNPNGTGYYDIYDHNKEVSTFLYKKSVADVMNLESDNVVATPVLQHYKYRVRYYRADASAFTVHWDLVMGEYDTRTGLWED